MLEHIEESEARRVIEDNAVEACRALARWPGLVLHEDPDIEWTSSRVPFPLFNNVFRLHAPPERAGAAVERVVDQAAERGAPLMWWAFEPDPELFSQLRIYGFEKAGGLVGMAGEISGLTLDHRAPEGVEIKEVESLEELRAWNEATAGLFGFPDFAARAGLDMYAHVGLGPESLWRHFIAEVDGEVAAVASLFTGPEAAMACGVAVAPGYRSRGLASVMTARTAKEAANAGYKVLTVLALAQAEGLYRRLGLKTFCRGEVYLWKGQAEPYDMDDSELTFSEPASKIRPQPQEQPTQGGSMNQETKQNQQQDPDQEPRLDLSFTRSTKDIASAAFIGALIAVVTLVVIYFVFREDISRYDKRIGAVEKQLRQDVRELRTSMNDRVSALESKLEGIEDLPQKVRAQILMDTLSEMRSRAVFLETQVDDPELKSRIEELQKSFTEIESGIKP